MLTAGLLFIHPSLGNAQERYDRGAYYYNYDRGDRDYRDHHEYDRHRFREEREARKWREKEAREREKWERRHYRDSHNSYRGYGSSNYGYRDPYRPY